VAGETRRFGSELGEADRRCSLFSEVPFNYVNIGNFFNPKVAKVGFIQFVQTNFVEDNTSGL
jgi:hypothetical protein